MSLVGARGRKNAGPCCHTADGLAPPPSDWVMDVSKGCKVCGADRKLLLCLGCWDVYCDTWPPSDGHFQQHCLANEFKEEHTLAANISSAQYACVLCSTTTMPYDRRLMMVTGILMDKCQETRATLASALRNTMRFASGMYNSYMELPKRLRRIFGSQENLTPEVLCTKWRNSLDPSDAQLPLEMEGAGPIGRNVVVMCGAGISVSCGIPDFRSPGTGLYDNLKHFNLERPEDMFSKDFFKKNPFCFYELVQTLWPMEQYCPSPAHFFLRLLHEKGVLRRVYTQNIDDLEGHAGLPTDMYIPAHGSFHTSSCVDCRQEFPSDEIRDQIFRREIPVYCSCGGFVKPDIVFFGERPPPLFFDNHGEDLDCCDLLIIMGTSLQVAPFNSLPGAVRDHVPRVLINKTYVPGSDKGARLRVDGPIAYRDICMEGTCDDGVIRLIDLMGWRQDYDKLWGNRPVPKPAREIIPLDQATLNALPGSKNGADQSAAEPTICASPQIGPPDDVTPSTALEAISQNEDQSCVPVESQIFYIKRVGSSSSGVDALDGPALRDLQREMARQQLPSPCLGATVFPGWFDNCYAKLSREQVIKQIAVFQTVNEFYVPARAVLTQLCHNYFMMPKTNFLWFNHHTPLEMLDDDADGQEDNAMLRLNEMATIMGAMAGDCPFAAAKRGPDIVMGRLVFKRMEDGAWRLDKAKVQIDDVVITIGSNGAQGINFEAEVSYGNFDRFSSALP
mmetsp:Transcript_49249/g.107417  ORF Transcript_49249/g.107417 Transcript_49249/m.107417 type:complete len:732 (+) Transcript_49249:58-2253(+)